MAWNVELRRVLCSERVAQTLCPVSAEQTGRSGWRHLSSSGLSEERRGSEESEGGEHYGLRWERREKRKRKKK